MRFFAIQSSITTAGPVVVVHELLAMDTAPYLGYDANEYGQDETKHDAREDDKSQAESEVPKRNRLTWTRETFIKS